MLCFQNVAFIRSPKVLGGAPTTSASLARYHIARFKYLKSLGSKKLLLLLSTFPYDKTVNNILLMALSRPLRKYCLIIQSLRLQKAITTEHDKFNQQKSYSIHTHFVYTVKKRGAKEVWIFEVLIFDVFSVIIKLLN